MPMTSTRKPSGARAATVTGLVIGAVGIGLLWLGGIEFPIYPPPGDILLLGGALFVALASWRWAPAVGAFFGLFVIVGFLISPDGIPNLLGEHGTIVSIGTVIQLIGIVTAFFAGLIALRHRPARQERGLPTVGRDMDAPTSDG